ncbi:hypothetical protein CAPTEDRAFT_203313 [Capitella teleta]|uniref:Uncharacterized protein n=1 Tax=Capitella teleta TaxID=283909 RepID=R7UAL7_CAPTE|nr:hypothetical protein CAPTEDRAFT_203313 [Capitella teleta]|eukprot:ELU03004.1 hypothetical protein CAPTEDRAFT_203313 [Capitella teleta]
MERIPRGEGGGKCSYVKQDEPDQEENARSGQKGRKNNRNMFMELKNWMNKGRGKEEFVEFLTEEGEVIKNKDEIVAEIEKVWGNLLNTSCSRGSARDRERKVYIRIGYALLTGVGRFVEWEFIPSETDMPSSSIVLYASTRSPFPEIIPFAN